jgi:hypothetical protein
MIRMEGVQMTAVSDPPRSRRALLGGGLAGFAAVATAALGRPLEADAATGGNAIIGQPNNATSQTAFITTTGNGFYGKTSSGTNTAGAVGEATQSTGRGLVGIASAASGATIGVLGKANSTTGTGVYGNAVATSGLNYGVFGFSASPDGYGVFGRGARGVYGKTGATAGRGVVGEATSTSGATQGVKGIVVSTGGTGVVGEATSATGDTKGVAGSVESPDGVGVEGACESATGSGRGVVGLSFAASGTGVAGIVLGATAIGVEGTAFGANGIGGAFSSEQPGSLGLRVLGRAEFSTAGTATIASGAGSVVVAPGVELTTNTKILTTLQSSAGGTTVVHFVAINTAANTFTIVLTANATLGCTVAWFVIG